MRCPHCNTGVSLEFEEYYVERAKDYEQTGVGYQFAWDTCPECEEPIVVLRFGKYVGEKSNSDYSYADVKDIFREEILYPRYITRGVEPEVPDTHKADFLEACAVLPLSPKASAALSRRVLQNVLREKFKIEHSSLAKEIDGFLQLSGVPSYLSDAVDAIRNIGNFAAHPLKDTHSGQIVDVEPGEAEWLLEVLEALFDFAFVQPKKLEERKRKLNKKLQDLGKPQMKG